MTEEEEMKKMKTEEKKTEEEDEKKMKKTNGTSEEKDTSAAFAQQFLGDPIETTKKEESPEDQPAVVVKLRNKVPKTKEGAGMQLTNGTEDRTEQADEQHEGERQENGMAATNGTVPAPENGRLDGDTVALLQRTMGALYEINPALEDSHEEIRKLDSQLDHLNDYMDRVEERLKAHNDKLMETLRQQREDRERRRQSFHERLEQSRQEDDDFQQQLSSVLSRVDTLRAKGTEEGNGGENEGQ